MKKIIIISAIVVVSGVVGYLLLKKDVQIKNTPPKNETVLIFGDSLAEGAGATGGNDLASRLEKRLGKPVLNYGRSGDTTRDASERVAAAAAEDPGVVIIILGGNDVLKKIPQAETFANLEKIVTSFQDSGAAIMLVGVRSGLIGDGRGDDFAAVAQKTGALYVPDILKGLFADTRYMSDAIHPNNVGYGMIEERLVPMLSSLFGN